MTRTRFALLLFPAVPLAPVLLGLAACADGQSAGGGDSAPSAPLGFELAMARTVTERADASADGGAAMAAPMIDLTPAQLAARLKAGNVRLIDVRTDAEVANGVIPGAEHIPLDRFDPATLDLSDGRDVVLYCRSGRRSAIAGEKLAAATGAPAQHLAGGILAWDEAGRTLAPR